MLVQPKTKGPAFECEDWSPFDACSCLREMQSKYALSYTCQARLTTVNGTISCPGTRVRGEPGFGPLKSRVTRWRVQVQPQNLAGTRSWRVPGGWYPNYKVPLRDVPGRVAQELYVVAVTEKAPNI